MLEDDFVGGEVEDDVHLGISLEHRHRLVVRASDGVELGDEVATVHISTLLREQDGGRHILLQTLEELRIILFLEFDIGQRIDLVFEFRHRHISDVSPRNEVDVSGTAVTRVVCVTDLLAVRVDRCREAKGFLRRESRVLESLDLDFVFRGFHISSQVVAWMESTSICVLADFNGERLEADVLDFHQSSDVRGAGRQVGPLIGCGVDEGALKNLRAGEDAVGVSLVLTGELVDAVGIPAALAEEDTGFTSEPDGVVVVDASVGEEFGQRLVDGHGEVVEQFACLAGAVLGADGVGADVHVCCGLEIIYWRAWRRCIRATLLGRGLPLGMPAVGR